MDARALRDRIRGQIRGAEWRRVRAEVIEPPVGRPDQWRYGAQLRGVVTEFRGTDDTPAPGSLRPGSVRVAGPAGELAIGEDVFVDQVWGAVTRAPEVAGPFVVDYDYGLLRVDAVVDAGDGPEVIMGKSHLSNPLPPPVPTGAKHLANLFLPYHANPAEAELLPVSRSAGLRSHPQSARLPRWSESLRGGSGRITCLGDSVTVGYSASSPATAYPALLGRMLAAHGLSATVTAVAVGGSTSTQWLGLDDPMPGTDWDRVTTSKPDLVTVEFVNDAHLSIPQIERSYQLLLHQTHALGADLLLVEPHFSRPDWMGASTMDLVDERPYVGFLREFARRYDVALTSVSPRWQELWSLGIPYLTMLRNGINHPDDRGHAIFAEEIAAGLGAAPVATGS
jgi:lysophospholipase L1-like esterase